MFCRSVNVFFINVTYLNGTETIFSGPSLTIDVNFVDCDVTFFFENIGRTTYYKSDAFSLTSYLDINCRHTPYKKTDLDVALKWSNSDCSTGKKIQDFSQYSGITARFERNSLSYGCNVIHVQLVIYNPHVGLRRIFTLDQVVFIEPSPLVVQIKGGLVATIANSRGIRVLPPNIMLCD